MAVVFKHLQKYGHYEYTPILLILGIVIGIFFESLGYLGRSYEYLLPHHYWPGRYNVPAHNLSPTDLPWNSLPAGSTAPFLAVTNWLDNGSLEWGPLYVTHSGRENGTLRATFYAMDDPVAERGLRFRGLPADVDETIDLPLDAGDASEDLAVRKALAAAERIQREGSGDE